MISRTRVRIRTPFALLAPSFGCVLLASLAGCYGGDRITVTVARNAPPTVLSFALEDELSTVVQDSRLLLFAGRERGLLQWRFPSMTSRDSVVVLIRCPRSSSGVLKLPISCEGVLANVGPEGIGLFDISSGELRLGSPDSAIANADLRADRSSAGARWQGFRAPQRVEIRATHLAESSTFLDNQWVKRLRRESERVRQWFAQAALDDRKPSWALPGGAENQGGRLVDLLPGRSVQCGACLAKEVQRSIVDAGLPEMMPL